MAKREEVVSQLKQRARKLAKYYPDKIQRIWFYGIVDIDAEFRIALKEENYTELFSAGSLFYKEHTVILDEDKNIRIPFGLYVLSLMPFERCRISKFDISQCVETRVFKRLQYT